MAIYVSGGSATASYGVQARHRFVQEQELRVVDYSLCDSNALKHSLGEFS